METINITGTKQQLEVREACIDNSKFVRVSLLHGCFEDVTLAATKITNANLSDLEIEGAQLGGAYIHNIGMPSPGHPMYDPNAKQRPLIFEHCDLQNSEIKNCDLSGVTFTNCTIKGTKINGVLIEELLQKYEQQNK